MKNAFCFATGIIIGSVVTYNITPIFQKTSAPSAAPMTVPPAATPQRQDPAKRGDIFSGKLKSVYDGDTFRIFEGEKVYKIRVWGIDAPELKQTCQKETETVACGKETKAALQKILEQGIVTCEYQATHRDRLVAICFVNGQDISANLIRQGLAIEDKGITKGKYSSYENDAKNKKLGLWGMSFDKPAHWRACNLPIAKDLRRPADCAPK